VTVLVALGLGFVLASLVPADPGTFVLSGLSIGLVLAGLATFVGLFVYGSKKVRPLVQPRRIGVTVGRTAAGGRGITSVVDLLFVLALLGMVVLLGRLARQFRQTGVVLTTTSVPAPEELKRSRPASVDQRVVMDSGGAGKAAAG
jgi:hypothetical protein